MFNVAANLFGFKFKLAKQSILNSAVWHQISCSLTLKIKLVFKRFTQKINRLTRKNIRSIDYNSRTTTSEWFRSDLAAGDARVRLPAPCHGRSADAALGTWNSSDIYFYWRYWLEICCTDSSLCPPTCFGPPPVKPPHKPSRFAHSASSGTNIELPSEHLSNTQRERRQGRDINLTASGKAYKINVSCTLALEQVYNILSISNRIKKSNLLKTRRNIH